jgi:hypothetical protein
MWQDLQRLGGDFVIDAQTCALHNGRTLEFRPIRVVLSRAGQRPTSAEERSPRIAATATSCESVNAGRDVRWVV